MDISLIDTLLDMTPTERLRWHAGFMQLAALAREQRMTKYGFDPWDVELPAEVEPLGDQFALLELEAIRKRLQERAGQPK